MFSYILIGFICSVHRFLINVADDDLQFCERISHIVNCRPLIALG